MAEKNLLVVSKDDGGLRLDRWLKENAPHIPYVLVQKLIRKGAIKVDGKKAKAEQRLTAGQQIRLPEIEVKNNAQRLPRKYSQEQLQTGLLNHIIYEDKRLIIINKPAGMASQGGSKVKDAIDFYLPALSELRGVPVKLAHRIDKDTSGVIVLGKGREATAELAKRFKNREVKKKYLALVVGCPVPHEASVIAPLLAKKQQGIIEKTMVDEDGKKATTHYKVLDHASDAVALVELIPETGRMHQLRVHMAYAGHPIVGDGKYGGKAAFIPGMSNKMCLHAHSIHIPGVLPKAVKAPLPKHMMDSMQLAGLSI